MLFDIVPGNFFNVFTSVNKEIYLEALLTLYAEYQQSGFMLSKRNAVITLNDKLDKKILKYVGDEDYKFVGKTQSEYSYELIRALLKYGWIEDKDETETLEKYLAMPPYATAFLETINNIINPNNSGTENCVLNIYLNVKSIFSPQGVPEHLLLQNAHQNSITLNRLLQDMAYGMKMAYDALLTKASLSDVLTEHFFDYEKNMIDRRYHPLKTDNNVFKYITEIQEMLEDLERDYPLQEKLSKQFKINMGFDTDNEAYRYVLGCIHDILSIFDNVDEKVRQLDIKHQQYLRTSQERFNYLSSRDKDLPSNIVKIITTIVESNDDTYSKEASTLIKLNSYRSLNERSLYTPRLKKPKFNPVSLKIDKEASSKMDDELKRLVLEEAARYSEFSKQNIKKYLDDNFCDQNKFSTRDIYIQDTIEWIKLILAYGYAYDHKDEYRLTLLDGEVQINGFTIPEIIFERIP